MPTRKLLALVFPEGLLFLFALALVFWGATTAGSAPLLRLLPLAVLVAGALLGWRFQRGRLLLALGGLVVADRAMQWLAPLDSGATHAGPAVTRTVAMLLPASLAALSFLPERSLFSVAGLRRLAGLAALTITILVAWLVSSAYPRAMSDALDAAPLPASLLAWTRIGQPASIVALLSLLALGARVAARPDAEGRGFLWAAVGAIVAAAAGPAGGRATSALACAGLVLVVATVESAYALAYHDELTGLPARRALNEALERVDGTYTVAMVDVDHFKKFNDTHGHDVGDQVLRMVAGRLARVPGGGRAFRYGGEEFAVLFPGKSAQESAPHLETLRASVADANFTQRGKDRPRRKPANAAATRGSAPGARRLAVTVSIGAAQARGATAPAEVVKAADRALYRAKEGGRNRVAI